MKKETIFRHELNESIQADAAMACLKNRNKPQQLNEALPLVAGAIRLAMPLLKPVIRKIVANLVSKMGAKAITGSRLIHTVMSKLNAGTIAKVAQKIGETWTEVPEELKEEIWAFAAHTFKELLEKENAQPHPATQEQEESTYNEKEAIAKQLMAKYNPDTDEWEDPSVWLIYAIQDHIGKQFLGMPKKELKAWKKVIDSAINEYEFEKQHPANYEHPEDADSLQSQLANAWDEGMEDDEDDYVPYNNTFDETHHDIVDTILEEVYRYFEFESDVEGFKLTEYTEEQIGKAIEQILDKTDDFPSSVSNNVCYAWVKKHVEELIKILETGSLENTYEGHPEFDFSEQEEMEVTDAKHALAQLAAELLHYDDGDLDELYYAISDIIDSEGYSPQPDEYEMWIEEHVNEIEDLIM